MATILLSKELQEEQKTIEWKADVFQTGSPVIWCNQNIHKLLLELVERELISYEVMVGLIDALNKVEWKMVKIQKHESGLAYWYY